MNFTKPGISFFIQLLLLDAMPESTEGLIPLLGQYATEAEGTFKGRDLLADLNLEEPDRIQEAVQRIDAQNDKRYTKEYWALWLIASIGRLKEALRQGDTQTAALEGIRVAQTRALLVFEANLKELVWRGYAVRYLGGAYRTWEENQGNTNEEFWQKELLENPILLSQIFSFPVVVFKDKAYVGGKGIENQGGKITDFLMTNYLTGNVALVEIKTPHTRILGPEYRGVYSMSSELTGTVVQLSTYKDTLTKEYIGLAYRTKEPFHVLNPRCVVIAGNQEREIDDAQKRQSFELFRHGLRDVEIITYDELFAKVKNLIGILERLLG